MSRSVLSASPSSVGNTAPASYYTHSSTAFPTSLLTSTTGPMLSGLHPPSGNLESGFDSEALSPLSSVAAEHVKNFPTFTNGAGMSADDDEEDHFDDYVQGDLDYDDEGDDGSQLGPDNPQDVDLRHGLGNMINQVLRDTSSYTTSVSGSTHVAMQGERRDRQRNSNSLSPNGSGLQDKRSTESFAPHRLSPCSAIHQSDLHRQHHSSASPASAPILSLLPHCSRTLATTAEQILNPASYEGMNTRSYGLTILADGSNGSRAFMDPLTGTAREPYSSGSGAATPINSGSEYVAGVSGAGFPLGVYAHYSRSGILGIEERGGSIDPGSLRSSPFHLPPSNVLSSHDHLPSQNSTYRSATGAPDGQSIISSRIGHSIPPHGRSLHSQNHLVEPTSYGRMVQSFPPKVSRRSHDPDFELNEHIFPDVGIPVNSPMLTCGQDANMNSPVNSLSSEYASAEPSHLASDSQERGLYLGIDSHNSLQQEDDADEEPLYVNAKQYHRIIKRRAARARLEELNQLIRQRKVSWARST